MNRIIAFCLILAATLSLHGQVVVSAGSVKKSSATTKSDSNKDRYIRTSIKDATWKRDIIDGFIIPYDADGNPLDTIKPSGYRWSAAGGMEQTSSVIIPVAVGDSSLVFDVGADGYDTETLHWTFKPIGKREATREMDPIFLTKKHKLDEVTVTASKVKFYNKGDTIVYDAAAFQLAEGSMLDALIAQLPGAEIDENGRITVNGEFVEELYLNGKDLFKDDHKVMIENIPAYTVKTVEVYKGHTKQEKFEGLNTTPTHLTMNVKLKKEYSIGWILNLQAGYGTSKRYLGRMFASWFSPTTTVTITGVANNLNDNHTPGKADSWTPESMPSGTISAKALGVSYNHKTVDEKNELEGNVIVKGSSDDFNTSTATTNFLSSGDTYERRFSVTKSSTFSVNTYHSGWLKPNDNLGLSYGLMGDYSKRDNSGDDLSATFNKDYSDISRQALDAIYGNLTSDTLSAIVNRSASLSQGRLRSGSFSFRPSIQFKIPNTTEALTFRPSISYTSSKHHSWKDYLINLGSNPQPADRRRQYTDESPNYRLELSGDIGYRCQLPSSYLILTYNYKFTDAAQDSYLYALERLNDMGAFGFLPADYASSLDPSNSYTSRTFKNRHAIEAMYNISKKFDKSLFMLLASPAVAIEHRRLDYWRDNRSYLVKRTSGLVLDRMATLYLFYYTSKPENEEAGQRSYQNQFSYQLNMKTETPELLHMVDVINDADPLNIQEGNPALKNALRHAHIFQWSYMPYGKSLTNKLNLNLNVTHNALVRGYVYDTSTGVRRYRTYNVGGNLSYGLDNYFNWSFGRSKQFTFTSATNFSISNNADMVGINLDVPTKAQVRNIWMNEKLTFGYKIGKQDLSVYGSASNRRSTSERPDFNPISAQHYQYGFRGTFAFPAGFGASTDFGFYSRVGYGMRELDTTDAIWNLRLTYTPPKSKWTFCADGFDILHQLSNVNYAVTATGRTVTYTNSLPRYFLFSVQYRLHITPRK